MIREEFIRVNIYLILFNKSTYTGDFRNTRNGIEQVPDVPVLNRTQLA